MGAIHQNELAVGRYKDASEAYNSLVNNNITNCNPYNGTISTSNGFRMIKEHPRYDTKKFWDFVYDTINGTKFDNWNCIELKGTTLKKAKEYNGYKGKRNIKAFFFWGLAAT